MHRVTMKSDSHSIVRLYLLFMRHAYFMNFTSHVEANEAMSNFIAPKVFDDQSEPISME